MLAATLDLLRAGGLSAAGINQIVARSGAPKGSVYHFFPGGKDELVAEALGIAAEGTARSLKAALSGLAALEQRVTALFDGAAARMEAGGFGGGCPVAAVTLDLGEGDVVLRRACEQAFTAWRDAVAASLVEVAPEQRVLAADLLLGAYEGALVLARARASGEPLRAAGRWVATALGPYAESLAGLRGRRCP